MGNSKKTRVKVAAALSGIALIVSAIAKTTGSLELLVRKLTELPLSVISIVVVVFFGVCVYFLVRGLLPRSELLQPQALVIDPDNRDHLKGREELIAELLTAVRSPLVFVDGESGSGKSALIRTGLLPELKKEKTLLPLYIRTYGSDWDSGPQEACISALWHELDHVQRTTVGLTTVDDLRKHLWTATTPGLLARIQNELGITPILIFDQFDDYQNSHRDRFLKDGKRLDVAGLTDSNTFWAGIYAELRRGVVRCLFSTRSDMYADLECVRFDLPQKFCVLPLESAYINALLEEMVTRHGNDEVIANPGAGWEA